MRAILVMLVLTAAAHASPTDEEVRAATSPLPPQLRGAAGVIRFDERGGHTTVRAGSNGLVCFRVQPGEEELDARCYHQDFMPVIYAMQQSRAQGAQGDQVRKRVEAAIKSGKLKLPPRPTVSYRVVAKLRDYDTASGNLSGQSDSWQAVHVPFATAAQLGAVDENDLSEPAKKVIPYAMAAGTFWAHVMIEHPPGK